MIADKLRLARQSKGMTQRQMAAVLGVCHQMMSKYERGVSLMDSGKLEVFCAITGFTPNELFGVADKQRGEKKRGLAINCLR